MPDPLDPPSPQSAHQTARIDAVMALAPALYRTARRLTQRPDDAAAVTLEAARALRAEEGSGEGPGRGAAFRALWRAVESRWREQGHVPRSPDAEIPEVLLGQHLAADEAELDRLLIARLDASPEVDTALRQLNERERVVVLLVDVEDLTREDVAEALGCSGAEVASLLLSGRVRLFASLVDYARRTSGWRPTREA